MLGLYFSMCKSALCLTNAGGCCECNTDTADSRGRSDINQKCEDERASQNLGKFISNTMAGPKYTVFRVVTSIEEINHADCKTELAIAHQDVSIGNCSFGSENTESANDNIEADHESAMHLNPYSGAGTFVMETGPVDNVETDCSEMEFVQNPDESDTTITMCYTQSSTTRNGNETNSEEESGVVNTNKDLNLGSQTRATPQKNGFTLDEELSRDVMAFACNDDGTSQNEATFGVLSSNRRDFNYSNNSFKAKIVGNSGLAGAYYQIADKTHILQDNQLTLPNPIPSSSDDPMKKLVTGT